METLRAERAVIDSELRNANVDMKSVFLSAAAGGCLNEPVLSVQHLDRAYSGVQDCVFEYPYRFILLSYKDHAVFNITWPKKHFKRSLCCYYYKGIPDNC